jgi:hypothetical protein
MAHFSFYWYLAHQDDGFQIGHGVFYPEKLHERYCLHALRVHEVDWRFAVETGNVYDLHERASSLLHRHQLGRTWLVATLAMAKTENATLNHPAPCFGLCWYQ